MLGMSETKNNPEGIRVSQQPGGRSNFTLKWLSPEPIRENRLEVLILSHRTDTVSVPEESRMCSEQSKQQDPLANFA